MMKGRKRFFRWISVLCLTAVLISVLPSVLAFSGVSGWAEEGIQEMKDAGLIPASMNDLDLRKAVTRQQMCEIAVTAYETLTETEIQVPVIPPFKDTDDAFVGKAYAVGIVSGYGDGTFKPENRLTRQEFFVIVYTFLRTLGWFPGEEDLSDLSQFPDRDDVAAWALDAARATVGLQIVAGDGKGLKPKGTTTCEQALLLFFRAYTYISAYDCSVTGRYKNLSDWAQPEVNTMDTLKLIPEALLGGDMQSAMTRKEMCHAAVLAYKRIMLENDIPLSGKSPFTDTDDKDIWLAYELGIASGFPDKTFRPDLEMTREQFFKIVTNFLAVVGYPDSDMEDVDLLSFDDGAQVSGFAKSSARLLVGLKLLKGSENKLYPQNTIPREQALSLFCRAYNYMNAYTPPAPVQPEPDELALQLVEFAMRFEGYPYVWGGKDPSTGFDCSGFVYYVYGQFGYKLNRVGDDQWESKEAVPDGEPLMPGDILFFSNTSTLSNITHVGLYIGDGKFIHAANSRVGVIISELDSSYYSIRFVGARRVIRNG